MSRFFGELGQVCWVVPNMDEALKHWTQELGFGPFHVLRNQKPQRFVVDGEDSAVELTLAFGYSGSVQIELIEQHNDVPSLYSEALAAARPGQHHMGFFAKDYDERRAKLIEAGYVVGQHGEIANTRFTYFRTNALPGTFTELIESSDASEAGFAGMREAAAKWDGTNPIQELG